VNEKFKKHLLNLILYTWHCRESISLQDRAITIFFRDCVPFISNGLLWKQKEKKKKKKKTFFLLNEKFFWVSNIFQVSVPESIEKSLFFILYYQKSFCNPKWNIPDLNSQSWALLPEKSCTKYMMTYLFFFWLEGSTLKKFWVDKSICLAWLHMYKCFSYWKHLKLESKFEHPLDPLASALLYPLLGPSIVLIIIN